MKIYHSLCLLIVFFLSNSCGIEEALKQEYLYEGIWRGVIKTQNQEIPFNFEVTREDSVTYDVNIINGAERVNIKGLAMQGDSVFIPINLHDAVIRGKLKGKRLIGIYEKNYDSNSRLPFEAVHKVSHRFISKGNSNINVGGKWEVVFSGDEGTTKAIGRFTQNENKVEGTFITPSGDFRYLDGIVKDSTLLLSTFDGANALLFKAQLTGKDKMEGGFWSGANHYQSWSAVKNDTVTLPNAAHDNEEALKDDYAKFSFHLPDLNGKMVELDDPKYKDKVKIIHIFGTWSSNSIDEIRFLADWRKENKNPDVVIIGLAFEQKSDFTYAKNRVNIMTKKLNVNFDFLIAGAANNPNDIEKLGIPNSLRVFPTTVLVDRDNNIRKVKAGFRSPASGPYFDEFVNTFNEDISRLLLEEKKPKLKGMVQ